MHHEWPRDHPPPGRSAILMLTLYTMSNPVNLPCKFAERGSDCSLLQLRAAPGWTAEDQLALNNQTGTHWWSLSGSNR